MTASNFDFSRWSSPSRYEPHDHIVNGLTRRVALRPTERNPCSPKCPVYLRRVCGVCPHFTGASMRARGQYCAQLCTTVDGMRFAHDCPYWSRKADGGEDG